MPSGKSPLEQFANLKYEVSILVNRRWWRWLTCWSNPGLWAIACYRIGRASYLTFGRGHVAIKFALSPILFLLRPWLGTFEIHYRADIGRGLKILHGSLGIVVSNATVAGRELTLTGGNCIGVRKHVEHGDIVIGDNVTLGVNAVVLGPIRIGNNVRIGAGAVVVHDAEDDQVLVGVPARGRKRRPPGVVDGPGSNADGADLPGVRDVR